MTVDHRKTLVFARARDVAAGILATVDRGRGEAYLPWFWRPIMAVVRSLPEPALRRIPSWQGAERRHGDQGAHARAGPHLSLEEKDRWWLPNVYRGDMPQLTLRSALTGMLLGGVLSLTNLYVGVKTGWTLGVGITSVILVVRARSRCSRALGLGREMTMLENNAMQSIATAAGYMTTPLDLEPRRPT